MAGVELATFPFTDHEVDGRRLQGGPELVEVGVGDEYTLRSGHQTLSGALLEFGESLAGQLVARGAPPIRRTVMDCEPITAAREYARAPFG